MIWENLGPKNTQKMAQKWPKNGPKMAHFGGVKFRPPGKSFQPEKKLGPIRDFRCSKTGLKSEKVHPGAAKRLY
jgi:hypothetical protein